MSKNKSKKAPLVGYRTVCDLCTNVRNKKDSDEYFHEDDMTNDITNTFSLHKSKKLASKIKCIMWDMKDRRSVNVTVITHGKLNENELAKIGEFINGQNSDGLGEGFEQQDFGASFVWHYTYENYKYKFTKLTASERDDFLDHYDDVCNEFGYDIPDDDEEGENDDDKGENESSMDPWNRVMTIGTKEHKNEI